MKRTKILATYGPAISRQSTLSKLISSGVDAFRINCSHGNRADYAAAAELIQQARRKARRPIGLLFDISGPKLRLDRFDQPVRIHKNEVLTLTVGKTVPEKLVIAVNHPEIISSVRKGHRLMIDDGQIVFEVIKAGGGETVARALNGGTLSSAKGINLPDSKLNIPTLGAKDRDDIEAAVELGADFIAISFVRSADDIRDARKLVKKHRGHQAVIAKLEKPEAVQQLTDIIDEADGVMIARGDLGVELPPEEVPRLQRQIIRLARSNQKPVIVATQMLESMRHSPRATRAEVNDVASAVFDAADAVMLSAETAAGEYPLEAVKTMCAVIEATEEDGFRSIALEDHDDDAFSVPHTIARAVHEADAHCQAAVICAFTTSGYTARLITSFRPSQPVLALTSSDEVGRLLSLQWSVYAAAEKQPSSFEEMIAMAERHCRQFKLAARGDKVIITGGAPFGTQAPTNFLHVHEVT